MNDLIEYYFELNNAVSLKSLYKLTFFSSIDIPTHFPIIMMFFDVSKTITND